MERKEALLFTFERRRRQHLDLRLLGARSVRTLLQESSLNEIKFLVRPRLNPNMQSLDWVSFLYLP
jgi:hypothetical protein